MAWQKPRFERFFGCHSMARGKHYRFRLIDSEGQVVCLSEPFDSEEARDKGIEAVRRAAELAKVVDV